VEDAAVRLADEAGADELAVGVFVFGHGDAACGCPEAREPLPGVELRVC
jgi:hypothetical protein